jgi:LPXTG-motif cell wall-anchored protein
MNKLVAAVVAAVVVAFGLVAPATSATAATYPPASCDIQVSSTQVRPGQPFTVTVTADKKADITATYLKVTRGVQDARRLVAEFVAPRVSRTTVTRVITTCDGQPGSIADITVVAGTGLGDSDSVADADADAGDANGILPGTGGTDLWLLVLGALLVLAGVGAVVVRRRNDQRS